MSTEPIIITGMHRSGTSLAASILRASGVHIGERLLGARGREPKRPFSILTSWSRIRPSWRRQDSNQARWTTETEIPWSPWPTLARPRLLVEPVCPGDVGLEVPAHGAVPGPMAMPLPAARFVFVTRPPWEVIDSLFRRRDFEFFWKPAPRRGSGCTTTRFCSRFWNATLGTVPCCPDGPRDCESQLAGRLRECEVRPVLLRPYEQIVDGTLSRRASPSPVRLAAIRRACPGGDRDHGPAGRPSLDSAGPRHDVPGPGCGPRGVVPGLAGRLSMSMMQPPLISVIVPTRNRPDRLAVAIASVLNQSYSNIELIVIDDGSDVPVRPHPRDGG